MCDAPLTRRKTVRWVSAIVVVLCLIVVAVSWQVGTALVAAANRPVGDPPPSLPAEATVLASDSGSQIATWHVHAPNAQATVIVLHGIGGNRRAMLGRAELLHRVGYGVVMIDLQAHGESPGEHITLGHLERHDVRAAVEFVRKVNPTHRVGIVGQSLGGAAALLAGPLEIDALVLESVYTTISQAVNNRVRHRVGVFTPVVAPLLLVQLSPRLGVRTADLRPIDYIANVDCPVLIAAGGADMHTTVLDTEKLFAAAVEPKELVIFPSATHVDLLDYDTEWYEERVMGFLVRHLSKRTTEI